MVFSLIGILIILGSSALIQTAVGNQGDKITVNAVTLMLANTDTVYVDDYFIVWAKLESSVYDEDHKTVELFYKVGESGSWTSMGTHETSYIIMDHTIWGPGSVYQYFHAYNFGVPAGSTVYFKAVFAGDSEIDPCTAETSVNTIIRPTSIALDPMVTLVSGGSSFNVYSKLSSYNCEMAGKVVEFFYKVGVSGSWTSMGTSATSYVSGDALMVGDGVAFRSFDPVSCGVAAGSTVYFKVVFAGDAIYAPCSAEGGGHFVVPEYPIGTLAVLFSCFAALVVSRKLPLSRVNYKRDK